MSKFKHWCAAVVFISMIAITSLAVVAVIGYLGYLLVTEFPKFALLLIAVALFGWGTRSAENYIDKHGWPWKTKHPSERVEP